MPITSTRTILEVAVVIEVYGKAATTSTSNMPSETSAYKPETKFMILI
jgi:hypothetical protein